MTRTKPFFPHVSVFAMSRCTGSLACHKSKSANKINEGFITNNYAFRFGGENKLIILEVLVTRLRLEHATPFMSTSISTL